MLIKKSISTLFIPIFTLILATRSISIIILVKYIKKNLYKIIKLNIYFSRLKLAN